MIDPNKGIDPQRLVLLRDASLERMCTQMGDAVEKLLSDFDMTWNDLADRLQWKSVDGNFLRIRVKEGTGLTLDELNDIAHEFSAEPYVIFRPRFPWTAT